jgi:hypothetical protein
MGQRVISDVNILNRKFSCMTQSEKKKEIWLYKQNKKYTHDFDLGLFSAFSFNDIFILIFEGDEKYKNWVDITAFSSPEERIEFLLNNSLSHQG